MFTSPAQTSLIGSGKIILPFYLEYDKSEHSDHCRAFIYMKKQKN